MKADDVSLQFDKNTLGQHRHICAFFNSSDEQHRVLRSFVRDGFDHGDKAFHYVDPERWDEHLEWLADAGVEVVGQYGELGLPQREARSGADVTAALGALEDELASACGQELLE